MGQVKYRRENNIAILSIERPEALNALSRAIVDELDAAAEEIHGEKDLRCLILHSDQNFAAGADIKAMADCDEEEAKAFSFSPTFNKLARLELPVIAAMEGYTLGGGMELALTADFRIAGKSAKMGFPEVTLGIFPGAGGTIRLPRIIGESAAKELIFTGDIIDADKAKEIGLVNHIAADEDVLPTAKRIAQRIAKRAPIAVREVKKVIEKGLQEPDAEKGIRMETDAWAALFKTSDQKEGMKAFMEKRKPSFINE